MNRSTLIYAIQQCASVGLCTWSLFSGWTALIAFVVVWLGGAYALPKAVAPPSATQARALRVSSQILVTALATIALFGLLHGMAFFFVLIVTLVLGATHTDRQLKILGSSGGSAKRD